jgi:hypothetical protein
VQNKPLNTILELTSSLEETPDARCRLFGGGPDVPFDPNTPHCIVSMVKSLRNSEGSGDGSTAILRVEDEQFILFDSLINKQTEVKGLKTKL